MVNGVKNVSETPKNLIKIKKKSVSITNVMCNKLILKISNVFGDMRLD